MELIVQTSVNMLILSVMYILVALGFAFLFNMLGILNLAHGAIYMIGGYIGYFFIVGLGINNWIALIITVIILAALGIFLEKFCFRPFAGDFNRVLMVCIAIILILQTSVNLMVGTKIMAIPSFIEGVFRAGPISLSYERIATFIIGIVLLILIMWLVERTKWGQQMQAISQERTGSILQGISIRQISAFACALGCGLAAIAGCLMGAYLRLSPFMGDLMLIKVLIIVILAGVGSLKGIIIAGFILGALNSVLPVFLGGAISDALYIAIVIILVLVRPYGFFGREA